MEKENECNIIGVYNENLIELKCGCRYQITGSKFLRLRICKLDNKIEMKKLDFINQLKKAGFEDLVRFGKNGKETHYELGHAIDKFCK